MAKSKAMLADTAAMAVDACTYAFNLVSERRKPKATRKQRLLLELVTPLFSVITLLCVNVFSTRGAVMTLIHPPEVTPTDQPDPYIMLVFSSLNLGLDILNVTCFARAKKLFGYEVHSSADRLDDQQGVGSSGNIDTNDAVLDEDGGMIATIDASSELPTDTTSSNSLCNKVSLEEPSPRDAENTRDDEPSSNQALAINADSVDFARIDESRRVANARDDSSNLNMCSAYTVSFHALLLYPNYYC